MENAIFYSINLSNIFGKVFRDSQKWIKKKKRFCSEHDRLNLNHPKQKMTIKNDKKMNNKKNDRLRLKSLL